MFDYTRNFYRADALKFEQRAHRITRIGWIYFRVVAYS